MAPREAHFKGTKACGVLLYMQPLPGKAPKGKWNLPRSCRRTPLLSRVRDFVKAGAIAPSCLQTSPGEWTPRFPTSLPSQVGLGSSPIRGATMQRGIMAFTNLPHSFVTIYCAAHGSPEYFLRLTAVQTHSCNV